MIKKLIAILKHPFQPHPGKPAGSAGVAYEQGFEAIKTGEQNPYPDGSRFREAWKDGAREADRLENTIW
jgi:hypothetical protein